MSRLKTSQTIIGQLAVTVAQKGIRQHAGALDVALQNYPLQRLVEQALGKAIERHRVAALEETAARAVLAEIRALTKIARGIAEPKERPFFFRDVLPILTRALAFQGGEWSVRQATVRALGEMWGDNQVVPLLGYILENEGDMVVRRAAAMELSNIEGAEALAALFLGLGAKEERIRQIVTTTFESRPNRRYAIPVLENSLTDPDPALRHSAADLLDRIESKPKGDEMRGWYLVAKRDWDAVVAEPKWTVPALENALRGKDAKIRAKAADALDEIDWKPAQFATRGLYAVARQRWGLAVGLKMAATAALVNALDDDDPAIEKAAGEALEQIGPDAVPSLLAGITDGDGKRIVRRAAGVLGRIAKVGGGGNNPFVHKAFAEAVPVLTHSIQDRHGKVVLGVAFALGDIAERMLCGPPALSTAALDSSSEMLFDSSVDVLKNSLRGQHVVIREGLESVLARIQRARKDASQRHATMKRTRFRPAK